MGSTPLRIIQISDMHLMADTNGMLLSVKTQESFEAVVELIKQTENSLDLILLSGDLSQDGSEVAYKRISSLLKDFHVPVYFVPGNHDRLNLLSHVYPSDTISNNKHIILKDWHLILLNSQKPGSVEGYLDRSQLEYLKECMEACPDHHAIIVFHHQPVPVGSQWLDNVGLKNADEFWQFISSYPKINTVLFGHVHQEFERVINGIKCYAPPSTCIQFMRNQDKFGLENLPPGYRWVHLHQDGRVETGVRRVEKYIGVFEDKATGY